MNYIITDGHGYIAGRLRRIDNKVYTFWSSKKVDATRYHFYEVAERIAKLISSPVKIVSVP